MSGRQRRACAGPASAEARAALERARRISDPYLRAQEFARLAWHDHAGAWEACLAEALTAAAEVDDPFQRTAVLAWPLRVQLERGRGSAARVLAGEALARARALDVAVIRADALMWLWHAAVPYAGPVRDALRPALVDACTQAASWKGAVYLRDAALTLAPSDPAGAAALFACLPEGKQRRQGERRLTEGRFSAPRWFFDPPGSSAD